MSLDRPPNSQANSLDNFAIEITSRKKVVLIVDTNNPHIKKSKFRNFITLPLFKFLEYYHPRTVEQVHVVFVCYSEKILKNMIANEVSHHPSNKITGAMATKNEDLKCVLSVDEAIQLSKPMLKIHRRLLELAKNYWLSDLDISACLSKEGPDVVLASPISSSISTGAIETPKHNPLKQQQIENDSPSVSSKNSKATMSPSSKKKSNKKLPTSIKKSKSGSMNDNQATMPLAAGIGSSLDGNESKESNLDLDSDLV